VAAGGGEIFFLRNRALWAHNLDTKRERQIVDGVLDFSAAPDGQQIALIRKVGQISELWTVQRDGSGLTQRTHDGNGRIEATPSWSPDGQELLFASSTVEQPYSREWQKWASWCKASEVRLLDLAGVTEQTLAPGCDPAFSPDGKRIAFATPPVSATPAAASAGPMAENSIRLINRQGQNGWNFAVADGSSDGQSGKGGLLVYAPSWSPDGSRVLYHRFLGYHALVDLNVSEIGASYQGKGKPVNVGFGWQLPARFAPAGGRLAIPQNNYSDARGFGGYDNWLVSVVELDGSREVALPSGSVTVLGQELARLPRAQAAVWSPDGTTLATQLPPGWKPNLAPNRPFGGAKPGEIWRWRPGSDPDMLLVRNVDFASPLAWLS
jgi:Tol biopolymer transport system component